MAFAAFLRPSCHRTTSCSWTIQSGGLPRYWRERRRRSIRTRSKLHLPLTAALPKLSPPSRRVLPVDRRSDQVDRDKDEVDEDDDGEDSLVSSLLSSAEKDQPWRTLLELPARASWRITSPQPVLAQTLEGILNKAGRTSKFLTKTHQEIIGAHKALSERRERERLSLFRNQPPKEKEIKQDAQIQSVLYGPDEALANLKFRCLPNYAVVRRVLQETRSLLGRHGTPDNPVWTPRRILDFGIGCGSSTAACLDVWHQDLSPGQGIEWIHGIDPSQTMREAAQTFLTEYLREKNVHDDGQAHLMPLPRLTFSAHLGSESTPAAFDLALFTYTATELPQGVSTLAAAALLWEKLRPNGLLVMIEPGTPDGFSSVRSVRKLLLSCCRPDSVSDDGQIEEEEQCHILAPCTHNGPCPMERFQKPPGKLKGQFDAKPNDPPEEEWEDSDEEFDSEDESEPNVATRVGFCSFVQSLPSIKGRDKREKFSYLVAQKRVVGQQQPWSRHGEPHRFQNVNLTDLLTQTRLEEEGGPRNERLLREAVRLESEFLNSDEDDLGLELVRGDDIREKFGRIINTPKKKKGHVYIDYCAVAGISTHKISKGMSRASPGLYPAARKSKWGGLWPDVDALKS